MASKSGYEARTFEADCIRLIKTAAMTLEEAVDRYNWANVHRKEILKYNSGYRQEWLRIEIGRVFSVDPVIYTRTATHIGGGRRAEHFLKGREFIRRFGVPECLRADRLLTQDQLTELLSKVTEETSTEQFRQIVNDMAEVLSSKLPPREPKMDYQREYLRLLAENAELRKEIEILRAWRARFERVVENFSA